MQGELPCAEMGTLQIPWNGGHRAKTCVMVRTVLWHVYTGGLLGTVPIPVLWRARCPYVCRVVTVHTCCSLGTVPVSVL